MTNTPSRDELERALSAAVAAHHDYEHNVLKGIRDAPWSGFYAAYTLGRLGDFTTPDLSDTVAGKRPRRSELGRISGTLCLGAAPGIAPQLGRKGSV